MTSAQLPLADLTPGRAAQSSSGPSREPSKTFSAATAFESASVKSQYADEIWRAKILACICAFALMHSLRPFIQVRQMRISTLLFASFVILIEPLPTRAEQPSGPIDTVAPVSRTKSCGESFPNNSTEEFNRKCIALAGSLAAMRGETLALRMDNGDRKIFENKNGVGKQEGGFGYGLADFYPSTHIFVVCDYGADSGHVTAVDGKTGRQLDFGYAFPQFSLDGNWVLTVEYGGEETNSSFAILDIRGRKPLKVWTSKASKTPLPLKVRFVAWDNDKTIRLASPSRKPVFLIQAADGTWGVSTTPAS